MSDNRQGLWGNTEAYQNYMGRWSLKVAPIFLDWLKPVKDKSWVDIGCGTGGLTDIVSKLYDPKSLVGVDNSEVFIELARDRVKTAEFHLCSAEDLPFETSSVDYIVSALVLNFLPDPIAALKEMVRIGKPGAKVAHYVWDYAGHMQIMRNFFDAAGPIDPTSANFDDGIRAPICRPLALKEALCRVGLVDVEVKAIDITTPFESFDDYWTPFLGGVGSAPKYCVSLDEQTREKIKQAVKSRLPVDPDGRILLAARVWAACGLVPG